MVWASLAAFWAILLLGVAAVVAMLFGQIVAGQPIETLPPALTVIVLGLELLLIPPVWFWGPRKYGGGWAALGLRRFRLGWGLLLTLVCLVLTLLVNLAWEPIRQRLGWQSQGDVLSLFGPGLGGLALAIALGGVAVPIAEELFFRGFIYTGLRHRWGLRVAVTVSAVIFSLVHMVPGVLLPIFAMGVLFALLFEATDSLWPCILLHGLINSLAFVAAYFAL